MANKTDLALIKPRDISYVLRMNDVEAELLGTSFLRVTGGCCVHMPAFPGSLPPSTRAPGTAQVREALTVLVGSKALKRVAG